MGNLPCPMPADFKHQHSHLMYAIRVGKTVEWIEAELEKCRNWHESKGILRTNWNTTFLNWLRKAVEFELQQAAGRRAYGQVDRGGMAAGLCVANGGFGGDVGQIDGGRVPSTGGVGELARKIEAYQAWLKSNPKLAQEYLERQPARVRRAILGQAEGG